MPKQHLYLALDQGGHSSRAFVFDQAGQMVAQAKYSTAIHYPQADWAEQDPEEIIHSMKVVVAAVLEQLGERSQLIAAAGLATQRSNVVCWDKHSGEALSAVISWQDRRAHQWLEQFMPYNNMIHQSTGLRLTAHYGASKLHWCLQHLPAVKQAFADNRLAWGPMASFVNFRLTREKHHLVDPANASRTLLWNIKTHDWDRQLLSLFAVPSEPLPRCVPTSYEFGTLDVANHNIPLQVVTGDQSAALFAYGMPQVDTAYINIGTGAFVQKPTLNKIVHAPRLLSSIVLHDQAQTHYVVECTVNGAGSALTQVEEQMGMSCSYAEEQLNAWLAAADNPPLFLNGISGLGTPFWVPNFPSRFQGHGEDWEKIVAVVESIVFLLKVNLEELDKVTSNGLEKIIVSGGLALSDGLCQKIADLTQVPLYRPLDSEATARGTAFLLADYPSEWLENQTGDWVYPQPNQELAQRYRRWGQAMQVVLRDYPSTVTE